MKFTVQISEDAWDSHGSMYIKSKVGKKKPWHKKLLKAVVKDMKKHAPLLDLTKKGMKAHISKHSVELEVTFIYKGVPALCVSRIYYAKETNKILQSGSNYGVITF